MRKVKKMADEVKRACTRTRQELADLFVERISAEHIDWQRGWSQLFSVIPMENGFSHTTYRGVNQLILNYVAEKQGFNDARWYTHYQVTEMNKNKPAKAERICVKAGSKATHVEYWQAWLDPGKREINGVTRDEILHKAYVVLGKPNAKHNGFFSFSDARKLEIMIPEIRNWGFIPYGKDYYVFNACQINGIEIQPINRELPNKDIKVQEIVSSIADGMGVKINYGGDQAFYTPGTDQVTVPDANQFYSEYECNSTILHELGHATGHPSRLSRDQSGMFGTVSYAKEELVAEITSGMMGLYLPLQVSEDHINNHVAYLQNWAIAVKKDPNVLARACAEAMKASDYMLEKGRVLELIEEQKANMELAGEANQTEELPVQIDKDDDLEL